MSWITVSNFVLRMSILSLKKKKKKKSLVFFLRNSCKFQTSQNLDAPLLVFWKLIYAPNRSGRECAHCLDLYCAHCLFPSSNKASDFIISMDSMKLDLTGLG